jgi:hypothetical protein
VFCRRTAADGIKLTREDVIPLWARKSVLADAGAVYQQFEATDIERQESQRPSLGMQARRVCAGCNNGWMSRLQERAQPFLESMLVGRRVSLSKADAETLAGWSMMTGLMLQFTMPTGPTGQQVIPVGHDYYGYLWDHGTPPEDVTVWLGSAQVRTATQTALYDFGMRLPIPVIDPDREKPFYRVDTYLLTYAIECLVVQLFGVGPELYARFVKQEHWDRYLVRVWPDASASLDWPPSLTLERAQLDYLARRFGRPSDMPTIPDKWYGPDA